MTMIKEGARLLPVLKVNNREKNLEFFTQELGLKPLLEDGPFASLTDASKEEKLVLEEVPGNRIRAVVGPKKLARLVLKVADPREIESLLAAGAHDVKLYQGDRGWAFEALSPQGDLVLLHAEEDLSVLIPYEGEAVVFEALEGFHSLTSFELDLIEIHTPDPVKARDFYDSIGHFPQLAFVEQTGPDLLVASDHTWDLSRIHIQASPLDLTALEEKMREDVVFVPKNRTFLLAADPSQIELWFEKKV